MARMLSLGLLVATAFAGSATAAAAADPITVKISDHFPAGHIIPATLTKPWMERVEELTGLRLDVAEHRALLLLAIMSGSYGR